MKNIFTPLLLVCLCESTFAQETFSNNTTSGLEKVIQDYPNRFKNIKGEVILENPLTIQYHSKIQITGSHTCMVTRSRAFKNDLYSWECVVMKTEDFRTAKNKFKEIYDQIKNSIIKLHGEKPYILNGQYEEPDDEKKITTIHFELLPAVGDMKKIRIALSCQYELSEWKISLQVYDGEIHENASNPKTR